MNPELKAKWIAALRSGNYAQCRAALKDRIDHKNPGHYGYCCLGVLLAVEGAEPALGDEAGDLRRFGEELSPEFCKEIDLPPRTMSALMGMNDGMGQPQKDFPAIADYIEKNL